MPAQIIAGNWKMNLLTGEALPLTKQLSKQSLTLKKCEIWIAPSYLCIPAVSKELSGSALKLGAQNVYPEKQGAFTGEVSFEMLREFGVSFALVGHSERRHIFAEDDKLCTLRALGSLKADLKVIFCVGEKLEQREAGETEAVLSKQLTPLLDSLDQNSAKNLVLAYEPVWAIGSGKVASNTEIAKAHQHIASLWPTKLGLDCPPILYGGSVTPDNCASILQTDRVGGALVGGASLSFEKFSKIVEIAERGALQ